MVTWHVGPSPKILGGSVHYVSTHVAANFNTIINIDYKNLFFTYFLKFLKVLDSSASNLRYGAWHFQLFR